MRTFSRVLLAGWLLYLSTVALVFADPGLFRGIPQAYTWAYFGGGMAALLLSSFVYKVVRVYRAGMRRARGPARTPARGPRDA